MDFMEKLLETGIISYIHSGMYHIISEIIGLAASSEDWQQVTPNPINACNQALDALFSGWSCTCNNIDGIVLEHAAQ